MPCLKLQPFCLQRVSKKVWNPHCGIQFGHCCLPIFFFSFMLALPIAPKFFFGTSKTSALQGVGGGRPTPTPS